MAWKARYSCSVKLTDGTVTSLKSGDVLPSNAIKDNLFVYKFFWTDKEVEVPVVKQGETTIEPEKQELDVSELRASKANKKKVVAPIYE